MRYQYSNTFTPTDALTRILRRVQLPEELERDAQLGYGQIATLLAGDRSHLHNLCGNVSIRPQGSAAIGTVIRPVNGHDFDYDLLCITDVDTSRVHSRELRDEVLKALRRSKEVSGMIDDTNPKCIRIVYPKNLHLDIVPAARASGREVPLMMSVPKGDSSVEDSWRITDPLGYVNWYRTKENLEVHLLEASIERPPEGVPVEEKPSLALLVQFMKHLRNRFYREEDPTRPSTILLTTMVCHRYSGETFSLDLVQRVILDLKNTVLIGRNLEVAHPTTPTENLAAGLSKLGVQRLSEFFNDAAKFVALMTQAEGVQNYAKLLGERFDPNLVTASLNEYGFSSTFRSTPATLGVAGGASPRIHISTGAQARPSDFRPVPNHTFHQA